MKRLYLAGFALFVLFLFQRCNTLSNIETTNIEILVPGKTNISSVFRTAAVKYNNVNIAPNPLFNFYYEDTTRYFDNTNIDSMASKLYFGFFTDYLRKLQYFDTVYELPASDYSKISFNDSLVIDRLKDQDSVTNENYPDNNYEVLKVSNLIRNFRPQNNKDTLQKMIDIKFGLFTPDSIEKIDSLFSPDILISLDFFAATDGIYSPNFYRILDDSLKSDFYYALNSRQAEEIVMIITGWSFYDFKYKRLTHHYEKIDTINWIKPAYNLRESKRVLPPRKDALFNASDLAATSFTEYLVPHWVNVQRMYYRSGQVDLKKTEALIRENNWMEAAKIWKNNTTNKNKVIAAKSMFNLALACEMNGDFDAAIDWVTKSLYILGYKNPDHIYNCNNYVRILTQRKFDVRKMENRN